MKPDKNEDRVFPCYIFFVFFGVLLLMSGIHFGLIVLFENYSIPAIIQTIIPMLYWALIAGALTAYVRASVKRNYDIPFRRISDAMARLARGDFSVRMPASDFSEVASYLNQAADSFNKMAQELSGVETLRTDFVANVSHELKTPLAALQNYGTLLQQPGLSEEARLEYAKAITETSRDMASMITNILRLNKLEHQSIYPDTRVYDLGEQLSECLVGFESVWERGKIEPEAELAENVFVNADPELLRLVWNNLLSNAFKFTPPGGTVRLALRQEDGNAVVEVSDTGCGMTNEVGKHIFEKFYQGDTSRATKGNGLGLALVKRVIDITQAEIRVSSEVGKGTTFTVVLPEAADGMD